MAPAIKIRTFQDSKTWTYPLSSHAVAAVASVQWSSVGWSRNPLSSQTEKLMAGTKFSVYLGLKHYKKAKKNKTIQPFRLSLLASKF